MVWWIQGNDGGFYANVLIGPFGYPNAMGGFLLLTGGAAMAALTPDRGRLERGGALLGCAMSLIGLYLTRSRGVLLAAAVGLLSWALVRRNRWWPRRPLWGSAAALAVLAGLAILGWRLRAVLPLFLPTDGGTPDTSTQWRLHILRWTWAMIRDHLWVGVGPGAFPVALTHYQRLPYVGGENPHNLYLEIAAEYGLAAGILVATYLAVFLLRTLIAARRLSEGDPARVRLAALVGAVGAFALHSAFDLDWSFPAIALVAATLIGMISAHLPADRTAQRRGIGIPRMLLLALLLVVVALAMTRYYATSLAAWGRTALAAGDIPSARQDLDRSSRLNPLGYSAYHWLSWATLRSGDAQGAIEIAERTIRIAPQDPSGHALTGEIALAGARWRIAQAAFQHAVDRAPVTHLRYHAGLLEAAVQSGSQADAAKAYEHAVSVFTPERVLQSESRCLVPGDRYLLAHMSRTAARLYEIAGDVARRQTAMDLARSLSEPDLRGICATTGRPGQTSPEAAVVSFWHAWSEGGQRQAEQFILSGRGNNPTGSPSFASPGSDFPGQAGVSWVWSLTGGEHGAILQYEVEIAAESRRIGRCVQTQLSFSREGWYLDAAPAIGSGPCRP